MASNAGINEFEILQQAGAKIPGVFVDLAEKMPDLCFVMVGKDLPSKKVTTYLHGRLEFLCSLGP